MNNSERLCPANFKLATSCRNQYEFQSLCLDDLVPEDHKVRHIWDFVSNMNLSICLQEIITFEGKVGRPHVNPKILLTLWI